MLAVAGLGCGRFGFGEHAPSDTAMAACAGVDPTSVDYKVSGAGTPASPWLLCTAGQLVAVGYASAAWGDSFVLGADLDLANYAPTNTTPFGGLGTVASPFTGTFDGAGHTISNVTITGTSDGTGFFGWIASSAAVIQRLHLINVRISGGTAVGGLAGIARRGAIVDCSTSGTIDGDNEVGGLVGRSEQAALISSSSSSANVVASGSGIGGLIGDMLSGGEVFTSFATGSVTGLQSVGGLVGGGDFFGEIWACYATGYVNGQNGDVGGLLGGANAFVIGNSFATGNVMAANTSGGGVSALAGGGNNLEIANSFFSSDATCLIAAAVCPVTGAATAVSPSQLMSSTAAPESAWDFTRTWVAQTDGYPTLAPSLFDYSAWGGCEAHLGDAPFAGGFGTPEAPYLICSAAQLAAVATPAVWQGKAFRLMADITLDASPWAPIGNDVAPAWMIFDGNGKVITNFSPTDLNHAQYFGLFGHLEGGVKRLGMVNAAVTSNANSAGVIGGAIEGSTVDCYASGSVSAGSFAGGLTATTGGVVADCYAAVAVTTAAGGVSAGVAYAPDAMLTSFGAGSVAGTSNSGQLSGYDTYTMIACNPDTGTNQFNGDYYDTTTSCTGCCTPENGYPEPHAYFFDTTNPPMNTWDFIHVWKPVAANYPVLR